jgi:hypothetical protein
MTGDDDRPEVASDRRNEAVGPPVARESRPMIERIGLAAVAAVLAALFGGVAIASWLGGEPFLAVMGGIGSLMTLWVGVLTLIRG